jgi:hypothetical protein
VTSATWGRDLIFFRQAAQNAALRRGMTSSPDMAWNAAFRDGPLAGLDRRFAGTPIPEELVFGQTSSEGGEWFLLAWDALPVDSPWPLARYRLTEIVEPTAAEPKAIYGLISG